MIPPGSQLLPNIVVQLSHTLYLTYKTLPAKFRKKKGYPRLMIRAVYDQQTNPVKLIIQTCKLASLPNCVTHMMQWAK